MASVVAEIAMVPVGAGDASMSQMIADSVKVLDNFGLKYDITSTGTNVEGELDTIFQAVKAMDEVPFKEGAERVILLLRVDDRRDKAINMDYEQQSLWDKLQQ